uniref:Uncharacterized protein n=1 Tax=Ciona intestinalis TaxID=7719 RepID=F7BPB4_CIOIN
MKLFTICLVLLLVGKLCEGKDDVHRYQVTLDKAACPDGDCYKMVQEKVKELEIENDVKIDVQEYEKFQHQDL